MTRHCSLARIDATHELAPWFRAAYADYVQGLAAFDPALYVKGEDGVWQPDHVPYWLSDPDAHTLLGLAQGRPFGFACVGSSAFPYKSPEADHCLAEFFVSLPFRRRGLGAALADITLRTFPGAWELSVLPGNVSALRFWRRVLAAIASSPALETVAFHEVTFRCTVAPPADPIFRAAM